MLTGFSDARRRGGAETPDLLDNNVWVALTVDDHPHHDRAARYWREEAADRVLFCSITALGFLRLSTNAAVMRGRPLTVPQVWDAYRDFLRQPGVDLAPEPGGCFAVIEDWIATGGVTPRLWTDAYLAAFARLGGMRLVSLDADFSRFDGLRFLHLQD